MGVDNLVEELRRKKVRLVEVRLDTLQPKNNYDETVRGCLAETMARMWLSRCEGVQFEEDLPKKVNGYRVERTPQGILVLNDQRHIHEFDDVVWYEGQPVVCEVKSLKLNGIQSKISRGMELAEEIYVGHKPQMLLFFPFTSNKIQDARRIEEDFPQVRCVTLGYRRKELIATLREYQREYGKRRR